MAGQQVPRLTGMLRAHYHPKEEREFDPDKEFIRRKDLLKKRPAYVPVYLVYTSTNLLYL